MKTFVLCLLFIPFGALSQDTTTIEQYCEIRISSAAFSTKLYLYVDYGDRRRWVFEDLAVKDAQNKPIVFNTRIDALNYMGRQGWQLVHAIPDSSSGSYLLKKRVPRNATP